MKNRIILATAAVLILAVGLAATNHVLEDSTTIYLQPYTSKLISLPYNNNLPLQKASYLRNAIIAYGGTGVNVYNWTGTVWQRWGGEGIGATNFVILPGVGYKVISMSLVSWYVEGSHNPAVSISLTANIKKVVSIPYTSPSTTAALLRNEIVAAGGTGVSVYNWDGMAWQRWSGGGIGQIDFEIVPGTGYLVKSTSDVAAWYPASN